MVRLGFTHFGTEQRRESGGGSGEIEENRGEKKRRKRRGIGEKEIRSRRERRYEDLLMTCNTILDIWFKSSLFLGSLIEKYQIETKQSHEITKNGG